MGSGYYRKLIEWGVYAMFGGWENVGKTKQAKWNIGDWERLGLFTCRSLQLEIKPMGMLYFFFPIYHGKKQCVSDLNIGNV